MSVYCILFAGSGQSSDNTDHIWNEWETMFSGHGFNWTVAKYDGVGNTLANGQDNKGSGFYTGGGSGGWVPIVLGAWDDFARHVNSQQTLPEAIVIIGFSRGGVQSVVFGNMLYGHEQTRNIPVFMFTVDPVPGYHLINKGSFDMRLSRPLVSGWGARDGLRNAFDLPPDADMRISPNVRNYVTVLMQNMGATKSIGFGCQSPAAHGTAGSMKWSPRRTSCYQYEMPGDHGAGVSAKSKHVRVSICTYEILCYNLERVDWLAAPQNRPCRYLTLELYSMLFFDKDIGRLKTSVKRPHQISPPSWFSFRNTSRSKLVPNRDYFSRNLNRENQQFINSRHRRLFDERFDELNNGTLRKILPKTYEFLELFQ